MNRIASPGSCFHETAPYPALWRRTLIEAAGTALLVLAVAGSGLVSQKASFTDPLLAQVVSAVVTGGALAALIVAFGAASGGHFNPLISVLQWLTGERPGRCAASYTIGQIGGGLAGALLANALFLARHANGALNPGYLRFGVSEGVCTAALMTIVFGCARSKRRDAGPFAVGLWITAASLATPSSSLANPAIAFAALIAGGPLALPRNQVTVYLIAECLGAIAALPLIAIAYPKQAD